MVKPASFFLPGPLSLSFSPPLSLSLSLSYFFSFSVSFQTLIFTFHILGLWSVLCTAHHHASRSAQPGATIIIKNQNSPGRCKYADVKPQSFFFLPLIIHHKQKFPRPSKRCECAFGRWHCAASLPVGGRECSGVSLTSLFRGHSALVWIQKLLYSAPSDALSRLSVLTRYACLCLPSFSLRVRPFEVGLSRQPELSYTCH